MYSCDCTLTQLTDILVDIFGRQVCGRAPSIPIGFRLAYSKAPTGHSGKEDQIDMLVVIGNILKQNTLWLTENTDLAQSGSIGDQLDLKSGLFEDLSSSGIVR